MNARDIASMHLPKEHFRNRRRCAASECEQQCKLVYMCVHSARHSEAGAFFSPDCSLGMLSSMVPHVSAAAAPLPCADNDVPVSAFTSLFFCTFCKHFWKWN